MRKVHLCWRLMDSHSGRGPCSTCPGAYAPLSCACHPLKHAAVATPGVRDEAKAVDRARRDEAARAEGLHAKLGAAAAAAARAAADLAAESARIAELEEQLATAKSAAEHFEGLCSSQAQACTQPLHLMCLPRRMRPCMSPCQHKGRWLPATSGPCTAWEAAAQIVSNF